MKRAVLYVVLGILVVAAVAGVFVWRSRPAAQSEGDIRSVVVERGTMLVAVAASGSIEPQTRVALAFEVSGRVTEVPVEVGDPVESGDVLAQLDTRQLALQMQQAQASLALAESQLAQLRAGPRSEEVAALESNVQAAQAQVSAAAANRDQIKRGASSAQIISAEAQVAAAKLQVEVAQDRYDAIAGDGTDKEQANYNLYSAKQALAAAEAELDRLLAGADADELRVAQANVWAVSAQQDAAQAQLDLLLAGAVEEQITDAEAQVAQAQAALELAELSLRQATLRAPFDGVVAAVGVTAGEMATAGQPLVTVLDTSGFHITVSVDEIDVGRLSVGEAAEVTLDAFPDAVIGGQIESIAPVATLEGGVVYYDVLIELNAADAPVRADMSANATIVVDELTDVLVLPTWVVRVDDNSGQTYVQRRVAAGRDGGEDGIERVDVKLGVRHEGVVEVLDGLSEGDEIVWVPASTPFGFGEQ